MAAGAATAYDPAHDAGESGNSDVELDAESQQQLPNADDFGETNRSRSAPGRRARSRIDVGPDHHIRRSEPAGTKRPYNLWQPYSAQRAFAEQEAAASLGRRQQSRPTAWWG